MLSEPVARKKRRTRTSHPGVKLVCRVRKLTEVWIARWVDPDTGRPSEVSLTALGKTSDETRRNWCIEKSETLRARRSALASGVMQSTNTGFDDAVRGYYERREALKATTVAGYRNGTDAFKAWAKSRGIDRTESLLPKNLVDFRAWWVTRPKKVQAKGKKVGRGVRTVSNIKRSPLSINRGITVVRAMLNEWRTLGCTPHLTSDAIHDALRHERRHKPVPRFLRRGEIRRLLEAAILQDEAKYKITRAENQGEAAHGSTSRYDPIAPLIVAALLSGCRFGELAHLRWRNVDLDHNEIILGHSETKTAHGRKIDLAPTPLLARLLNALKDRTRGDYCFGGSKPVRRALAESARKRLIKKYGAPTFTWHDLRRTCGTFLTCAPGIYGGASAYLSAKRLGHSVTVAETHYTGAETSIDLTAKTLEVAMSAADLIEKIVASEEARADGEEKN